MIIISIDTGEYEDLRYESKIEQKKILKITCSGELTFLEVSLPATSFERTAFLGFLKIHQLSGFVYVVWFINLFKNDSYERRPVLRS